MKNCHFLFVGLFLISCIRLTAQTGPGGVGNSSDNVLWLRADAITGLSDGNTINNWYDQSGNLNNASQVANPSQPLYRTNIINGLPAVQFDNNTINNDEMSIDDNSNLDNTNGLTIYTISRPSSLDNSSARAIVSKRVNVANHQSYMLFFFTGNKMYCDLESNNNRFNTAATFSNNNNYIIGLVYDGSLASSQRSKIYVGGSLNVTASESNSSIPDNNSKITIGSLNVGDGRPFGGYIAEVIIFRKALNTAERIIVENYLSSKYNASLSINDKYAGDSPANGDYETDIAGIGKEDASNNYITAYSAGIRISQNSNFGNGDYLFYGHAVPTNASSSDCGGMSGSSNERWERIWYLDATDAGAAMTVNVSFDFSEGSVGNTPATASNYKLLYRSSQSGNWTEIATASSISGDQVNFSGIALSGDGYYTIGTINPEVSPLPIELVSFTATLADKTKVALSWTTLTETNNDFFTIEKSKNGATFEELTQIKGAGNSKEKLNYTMYDDNPVEGTSYYRLKQTDYDGKYEYSDLVAINYIRTTEGGCVLKVYPNPCIGHCTIDLTGCENEENSEITVELIDAAGNKVYSHIPYRDEKGSFSFALDTQNNLKPGVYIVRGVSSKEQYNKKIIVK